MTDTKPRYATINDFKRRDIDLKIVIKDDNGEDLELLLPVRTLSFFQVQRIRSSVPNPMPEARDVVRGTDGVVRPKYDYNDPAFRAASELAEVERMHRIFLAAIRQDVFPIPGDTDEEKLAFLKEEFDVSVVQAVIIQLNLLATEARAEIESRADSFHTG